MAKLAAAPPWIPEDDLLLKNAVEAGASLEALARGAVQFSRKFTVAELRDRWHSLLYDPVVSAEASARMIESELSVNKSGSGTKNSALASKRKFESVRRLYYAMRKRICRDSSLLELSDINYLMDLDIVEDSNPDGYMRDDSCGGLSGRDQLFKLKKSARCCEAPAKKKNSYNEFPSTCGDRAQLQEEIGCSHALPHSSPSYHLLGFPSLDSGHSLWKHVEDNSAPGMPGNVSLGDQVHVVGEATLPRDTIDCTDCSLTKYESLHDKMSPDERNGNIGDSAAISDKYLMDISDCLLNFANGEDLVSMDMDGKAADNVGQDVKDEKSLVTNDSCVLSCPDDKHEDGVRIPGNDQMMVGTTCLASQGSASAERLDAGAGQLSPGRPDQLQLSTLKIDTPSSAMQSRAHSLVEMYEETMACTLNTEDPEIPCNEDFPPPAALSCSTTQQSTNGSTDVAFPSVKTEKKVEEQNVLKEEENRPESASMVYQITGRRTQAGAGPNCHVVNAGGNFDVSGLHAGVVLKEAIDVQVDMNPCRLPAGSPGCTKDTTLEDKSIATDFQTKAAENSSLCNIPELDESPSKIDYEQDEGADHIPNIADIEAMILDLDLWPKDWDSFASKEVSGYKNDDARRAIIRMEQCARSSIQRAIGSRGALAVLYGRHSKHYIRKTEVTLGRSTADFGVDIDLVREGGTNRISRRQALIKLENEGSFSLKNLGKNSMFLNGKEVSNGECILLTPSCLIEVKGIAFVFEMNGKLVRQYLENLARESRREDTGFKWSPEGGFLEQTGGMCFFPR